MLDYKLVTFLEGMIVIKEAVISFFEKLKSANRLYKLMAFSAISVILILVSVFSSGVKLTYNLIYNGNVFANVSSKEVYSQAVALAKTYVSGKEVDFSAIEIKKVVSINETTSTVEETSKLLLANNPTICSGFEVIVGGDVVGYVSDLEVYETAKNNKLSSYNVEGAQCTSSFLVNVSAKAAYFDVKNLSKAEDIEAAFAPLDVQTVAIVDSTYTVKYETVAQKDATKKAGYQQVITEGVHGSNKVVKETVYLNGVMVSDPVVTTTVLRAPVNEVILVGIKDVFVTTAPQNASSAGFVWPLSEKGVITAPYGELRGGGSRRHQGVDIGVPVGTSVVAVKGGTVIEEDYDSDYGYYVIIDHGNGMQTRYAHNSSNTVSVGQTISAGQLIALSGNTGRSTGPHLHFEVIINGRTTNPGYSLDLK